MKVVFLNGPPHCGKDSAAERVGINCYLLKMAAPLKRACAGLLGETVEWVEKNKDRPDPRLNGDTPRNFLIRLSEDVIKPAYGDQFFGKVMVGEIDKIEASSVAGHFDMAVITDSGFFDEAIPVVTAYGITNCLQVQINREGKNFSGDSRSYWKMSGLQQVQLYNDGNIDQLGDKLFGILSNVWGCTR